jgi:hypothetical protein
VTDLERFFRRLVETLSAIDPAHLQQPVSLAEIRGSILPYRTNRRALHLETSEDYELVLMRLCAGEGGYATVTPDEVRARFKLELAGPNPDLTVLRQFGDASVKLVPGWVVAALTAAGEVDPERTAPETPAAPAETFEAPLATAVPGPAVLESESRQEQEPEPVSALAPAVAPAVLSAMSPAAHCVSCSEVLPDGKPVKFCPYCGTGQAPARCAACGTDLEPGWRFCAACGKSLA